jgi:ribosome biogenesis GTPase A
MTVKRSESSIQEAVVKYARAKGWRARKRSTAGPRGSNGEPDYEFAKIIPLRDTSHGNPGFMFFIEFKKEGARNDSTPLQKEMQQQLINCGFRVHVVDNVEVGKKIVDMMDKVVRGYA